MIGLDKISAYSNISFRYTIIFILSKYMQNSFEVVLILFNYY